MMRFKVYITLAALLVFSSVFLKLGIIPGDDSEENLRAEESNLSLDVFRHNLNSAEAEPVKIAVLDSGISDHPDLQQKVEKQFNAINTDSAVIDDNGHGTAVAGIIASNKTGIGQNVQIYDVKVLDSEGKGNIKALVKGLTWAKENKVDIINISSGVQEDSPDLYQVVKECIDNDILIVASAGNTMGLSVDYPAKYDEVLSITAVDKDFKRFNLAAKGKIDYSAPGVNVYTTTENGMYDYFSGTSFATAYFTGLLSNVLLEDDLKSKNEFNDYIRPYIKDLGQKGYDKEYGFGIVTKIE